MARQDKIYLLIPSPLFRFSFYVRDQDENEPIAAPSASPNPPSCSWSWHHGLRVWLQWVYMSNIHPFDVSPPQLLAEIFVWVSICE